MRILVVDDHEVVRKGICTILEIDSTYTVCGEAIDGQDAVDKVIDLHPDIVVMGISMPRMNGLEATREIKRLVPQTEIVIVSQHEVPEMIQQAFNAGARGYVVKSAISKDLLAALARVNHLVPSSEVVGPNDPTQKHLDAQESMQRSAAFEKALQESEARFRSAMNNIAEGLYILDSQGLLTYINPSAEAMFGWASAELLGKEMHKITHHNHPDGSPFPIADCAGMQVLQKGIELKDQTDVFIRKDGTFFPVLFNASPLKINGTMVGAVVSFHDDSKRRDSPGGNAPEGRYC